MIRLTTLFGAVSTAALLAGATTAMAQASGPAVEGVVVTGSRLARASTFVTPTPVTTVGIDQLQQAAPSTLAAGLQTLPSVVPGGGPTAGGGTANGGQNFLNLRGLGSSRTLVLLDGHRFTTSNASGVVDTNLLPSALVNRVDVVTGGASAAYGSDAVAGVINFVLDTQFTGWKLNASYGESIHLDNKDTAVTAAWGRDIGDKAHLIAGVEYYNNEGVDARDRTFRVNSSNIIPNTGGTPTNIVANDIRVPSTPGGLIVTGVGGTTANNAALQGIQFGPGGVPGPYNYGTVVSGRGTTGGFQSGGDGFPVSVGQEIVRPLERETVFLRGDVDVTPGINVFGEFFYGATSAYLQNSPTAGNITIQRDNAYLARVAPDLVTRMTTLSVPRLTMTRYTLEAGLTTTRNDNWTTQFLGGAKGDIKGFHWELSAQHGQNRNKSVTYTNLITANMAFATDAVINPANGTTICRATLPGTTFNAAAVGCVPLNPFGAGSPSPESLKYVMGSAWNLNRTQQTVVEGSVSGDIFQLPAGPVAVAVGGDWRKEELDANSDALSQAGAFRLVNSQPTKGELSVKEVFGEAQVPLLKDLPLIQNLEANFAGRHTDYSTSGGVNTWKAGLSWSVNSELRFRATRSRDIRAPNLQELYAAGRQNNQTIDDTPTTGRIYLAVPNLTFGNANLTPEKAITTVMGLIYRPTWAPGLNLAIDTYAIRIDDAIGNIGAQNAVTQCQLSGGTSEVCSFVTRDPTTKAIIKTLTAPFNLTVQKIDGVDYELGYRLPLEVLGEKVGLPLGILNIRLLASNNKQNVILSPLVAQPVNNAGTGAQPHWRGNLNLNYTQGPWTAVLQGRYIGDMTWDRTKTLGVDTNFNHIADRAYLDAQFSYKPTAAEGRQEYYINIQNVLNRKPAFDPSPTGATPTPTETGLYDQVGTMIRVGIRLRH